MRIGIDGRSLAGERARGVGRVTWALLAALADAFPDDEWRVLLPAGAGPAPPGTRVRRVRLPSRALFGAQALLRRPALDRLAGDVDVVWLPAPAPVAVSGRVPHVLTLHDLAFVERPRDFTRYERVWHVLTRPRRLALTAARLTAVSAATAEVARVRWGDLPPVAVVSPPVSAAPVPPAAGEPYFLWAGALEPRKGPDVLREAWARAHRRGLRARLVVAGAGREALDGPAVERRGHVPDAELAALQAGALALVAPSRLEGFGLPPLEAALRGTPSILTSLPAFRETLGPDGARWVAPEDADGLADALLELAGDPARRAELAVAAGAAARRYADPPATARALRAVLAEAAGA